MRLLLLLLPITLGAAEPTAGWDQVKAIFDDRCISCHGEKKQKGRLRLDSPEWVQKGGEDGKVVIPGDPAKSALYTAIMLPPEDEDRMPPKGERLTDGQRALIKAWIAAGAPADGGGKPPAAAPADDKPAETKPADGKPAGKPLGKIAPRPAPGPALPVAAAPPVAVEILERLAGEQIIVTRLDGGWLEVNAAHTRNGITGDQLALLAKAGPAIAFLDLAGSGITDRQLGQLTAMTNLQRLHLERNPIGDAGLAALDGLPALTYLNLVGTTVGDAGLHALERSMNLRSLYLWQTAVTPAGRAALQTALPDLTVSTGPDDLPTDKLAARKRRK